jgi:hypothetical protein
MSQRDYNINNKQTGKLKASPNPMNETRNLKIELSQPYILGQKKSFRRFRISWGRCYHRLQYRRLLLLTSRRRRGTERRRGCRRRCYPGVKVTTGGDGDHSTSGIRRILPSISYAHRRAAEGWSRQGRNWTRGSVRGYEGSGTTIADGGGWPCK